MANSKASFEVLTRMRLGTDTVVWSAIDAHGTPDLGAVAAILATSIISMGLSLPHSSTQGRRVTETVKT